MQTIADYIRQLVIVAVIAVAGLEEAFAETVRTIRANGDPANRVDVIVLGDGYTASELDKYAFDIELFIQALFREEPFAEYQRYFNVHRVDVISNESGADHPERNPQVFRDTALDATYNCAEIQRLICVNSSKVNALLTTTVSPEMRDIVLIIVNDEEYGGSGGAVAVASIHPAVAELILHELGHSFGLLADEYGGPPPPSCDASQEPAEPNATRETERDVIKWTVWIDLTTPIPTPAPTVGPGLYEGARYCDTGLWRPTFDSRMRSLFRPFEQINAEQLVKRVYNWASPIDQAEPADTSLTLKDGESQLFRVQPMEPASQPLEVAWTVDEVVVAFGSEFSLNASDWGLGAHTVSVVVTDITSFVRNDPSGVLSETRSWEVTIDPAVVLGPDLVHAAVSNPPTRRRAGRRFDVIDGARNDGDTSAVDSTTRFYLSIDSERNQGDRRLTGIRVVSALGPGEASEGTTRVRIPLTVVPGEYFLLACADDRGVQDEFNEDNNCRASETQIKVLPPLP